MMTNDSRDDVDRWLREWDESRAFGPVATRARDLTRLAKIRQQRRTLATRVALAGVALFAAFVISRSHPRILGDAPALSLTPQTDKPRVPLSSSMNAERGQAVESTIVDLVELSRLVDDLLANSAATYSSSWEELAARERAARRVQAESQVAAEWLAANVLIPDHN